MSPPERKRMHKNKKNLIHDTQPNNALIASCHDYASTMPTIEVSMSEENFPPLPVTPCDSPAAKKALYNAKHEPTSQDNIVITTLSQLIKEQADSIKILVSENSKKIDGNALKIEGLKKTVDFVCSEVKEAQQRVKNVDGRLKEEEKKVAALQTHVCELETYSRRWNLKVYGVAENTAENVKEKVTELCRNILPDDKLTPAIDVAHRIGKLTPASSLPRAIIIRFSQRSYRDAVWKAAKNPPVMRDNKLRFVEDLPQPVKEARMKMWPLVNKARSEGKSAYFVGARAFVNGKEIT